MSSTKTSQEPGELAVNVPCPFSDSVLNLVRYSCSCGVRVPLAKLYFCRYCSEMRCGYCVSHEVDSHYCPNCLENMPSTEARIKKNRCGNCFNCPCCGHTLSTKATGAPDPNNPSTPMKVYYLSCVFCRWSSRDIKLPNQTVASGGWPEKEIPHLPRISALQEYYRSVAQKEKLEKDSKRHLGGRKLNYLQLSDKYGLARKRAGLPPLSLGGSTDPNAPTLSPAVPLAIEELEQLEEEIEKTAAVDIYDATDIKCRLSQIDSQPPSVIGLFPRHMHLMIKRSQRCRKCEHNLSKPEYNPTSIKFKIQLAAFYHVPEVIIYRAEGPWVPGQESKFVIKVVNPAPHGTDVQFLSPDEISEFRKEEAERKAEEEKFKPEGSILWQPSLIVASDRHAISPNAICILPKKGTKVFLPPRDAAAEFDDSGPDLKGTVDDKSLVAWRKSNKVGVVLSAIPDEDVGDSPIVTMFGLKFIYTNTVSTLEQKTVQTVDIVIPVYITLRS